MLLSFRWNKIYNTLWNDWKVFIIKQDTVNSSNIVVFIYFQTFEHKDKTCIPPLNI